MKIKKWLWDGHHSLSDECETTEDLLESAGRLLDKACSHDIAGEVVFQGADGKYYVGCVEFVISEASLDYLEQVLDDIKEEKDVA